MVRGIERRPIFRDDADRAELLRRLSCLVPELGFRCFGWALMPNHVHLVVRSASARISHLLARLAGLDQLLREVCVPIGVTLEELRSRRRSPQLVAVRSALALRATAELGFSGAEVARLLGVTRAGVSWMLAREQALRAPNNLTT